jgi:alkylation response protein AidB-like acyl-CoA dehydrogenase
VSEPTDVESLVSGFLSTHPVTGADDRRHREARFDAGLAFAHFEPGSGGLGLPPGLAPIVDELFEAAGAPSWRARNVIGLGMAAPTIHTHGTPGQRQRYLRPLFSGEEIWCQLFSEPGAGSDLAGLSTRAVRQDGKWVVTGQKVWTTLGHVARWGLLLARTDPGAPKHRGLTYFILDMHSAGVEVRPLRQLTGEAEFNEVYLDEVVVADEQVLGPVGGGWSVAMTTLMNERFFLGGEVVDRGEGPIAQALAAYGDAADAGRADPGDLDRLMRMWTRAEAARLTNLRAADDRSGETPGPQASIAKLQMAELNKAIYDLATDLSGGHGLLFGDYTMTQPDFTTVRGGSGDLNYDYLRALANSIEGGTSEILHNVLGERVLGLPAEPRVDKDLPWNEGKRS